MQSHSMHYHYDSVGAEENELKNYGKTAHMLFIEEHTERASNTNKVPSRREAGEKLNGRSNPLVTALNHKREKLDLIAHKMHLGRMEHLLAAQREQPDTMIVGIKW